MADPLIETVRDFLRRLAEWDVLNLTPGSGDDGPYWQGEVVKARAALARIEALLTAYEEVAEAAQRTVVYDEIGSFGDGDFLDLMDTTRTALASLRAAQEPAEEKE